MTPPHFKWSPQSLFPLFLFLGLCALPIWFSIYFLVLPWVNCYRLTLFCGPPSLIPGFLCDLELRTTVTPIHITLTLFSIGTLSRCTIMNPHSFLCISSGFFLRWCPYTQPPLVWCSVVCLEVKEGVSRVIGPLKGPPCKNKLCWPFPLDRA